MLSRFEDQTCLGKQLFEGVDGLRCDFKAFHGADAISGDPTYQQC